MALENWKTKFDELFSELDDSWHLEIVNDIVKESGWLKVKYRGRATFKCSSATCNNTWPCANSGAVFYFRLSSSGNGRLGEVKLFLGGQKCIYCKDVFEAAEWPDTEIKRAITKLLNEVTKGGDLVSTEPDTDDQGIMTAHQHFSYLCQLCSLGVCVDIESGKNRFIILLFELLSMQFTFYGVRTKSHSQAERERSSSLSLISRNIQFRVFSDLEMRK